MLKVKCPNCGKIVSLDEGKIYELQLVKVRCTYKEQNGKIVYAKREEGEIEEFYIVCDFCDFMTMGQIKDCLVKE